MAGIIAGQYSQRRLNYECIVDGNEINKDAKDSTRDHTSKNYFFIFGLFLTMCISAWISIHPTPTPSLQAGEDSADYTSPSALPNEHVRFSHAVMRNSVGDWEVSQFVESNDTSEYAAMGAFTDAAKHTSYFGELHIKSIPSSKFSDQDRAEAAGLLEGYFTHERMGQTAHNLLCEVSCDGKVPVEINNFLSNQEEWITSMLLQSEQKKQRETDNTQDDYWATIGLIRQQFIGLKKGSQLAAKEVVSKSRDSRMFVTATEYEISLGVDHTKAVDLWGLTLINYLGDLFDIKPAVLAGVHREDFSKMSPEDASAKLQRSGHCTAMVKVTDDLGDLLWGHSSWFHYSNMNRIYKHYSLDFDHFASPKMTFSSYPGMLSSLDDFYLMKETSLSVVQTTNGIYNTSLYDDVLPQALPAWMRVRAANALASSGKQWATIVARHNGGTYNNQYLVVDAKRFAPGQALAIGTLWVVEQIPGLVVDGDATQDLARGYFPSYNVPYFAEIYKKSGYEILDNRKNKRVFSEYELAPRAKIFRRDQSSVSNLESLKTFLRSNGYIEPTEFTSSNEKSSSVRKLREAKSEEANKDTLYESRRLFDSFFYQSSSSQAGLPPSSSSSSSPTMVNDMNDPFALDPWMAICSRGDLNPHMESLQGCYDSKATSASLFVGFEAHDVYEYRNDKIPDSDVETKKLIKESEMQEMINNKLNGVKRFPMSAWVVNGPTNQNQPTFSWNNIKTSYQNAVGSSQSIAINAAGGESISGSASHLGQPAVFDFEYELMAPRWPEDKLPQTSSEEEELSMLGSGSGLIGGKKDAHGCFVAAGYSWCEALSQCVRVWETPCSSS